MNYALFKDGKQYSKPHSTKEAAMIEAYEKGVVVDWGADFIGDKPGRGLMDGYEIKEKANATPTNKQAAFDAVKDAIDRTQRILNQDEAKGGFRHDYVMCIGKALSLLPALEPKRVKSSDIANIILDDFVGDKFASPHTTAKAILDHLEIPYE